MLQKIRDHLTGWVAGFLFFIIAVAFALWGIDLGGADRSFIAKVNGQKVSVTEFRTEYQNRLNQLQRQFQDQLPDVFRNREEEQLLNRFIQREVIRQQAENQGYRVGDDALSEQVRELPAFQVDGQFNFDQYQAQLSSAGQSSTGFEQNFRGQLQMNQLVGGVLESSFITPSEFYRRYRLENETREVAYTTVLAEDYLPSVTLADNAVEEYYESHSGDFITEESVDIEYVQLRPDDYLTDVDVTEDEVRTLYDETINQYQTPELRDSRHILVSTSDRSDEQAQALANELLERINSGEDFAEIAKAHSDDTGSGAEGGNLGWAERQTYVGAFRDALFDMEVDEIRGNIKTEFGYHIIQMLGSRGGETKPFESVSAELEQELRANAAANRVYDLKSDVADVAYTSLDSLQPVADEFGLQLQTLDRLTRIGGIGIGVNRSVVDAAFSPPVLLDNENSDTLELQDGSVVVLRIREHHEVQTKLLEDVHDQIVDLLTERAGADEALRAGQALLEKLEAGEPWERVTEEAQLELKASAAITRRQAGLPSNLASAAFQLTKPAEGEMAYDGLALPDGGYVIFSVGAVIPGDVSGLIAEQRDTEEEQIVQRIGGSELAAYVGDLRDQAQIVVNQEQLELNQ